MEQLKVKKKDIIVVNVVIYLALAFFFLYLQHAYRHQLSPFSLIYLKKGFELFWYIAVPLGITAAMVWRFHRLSLWAFRLSTMLVGYKVIEGLFIEFNKIIVIALFFYVVVSYFLYQLLAHYRTFASINPNYSLQDLFDPLLRKISCTVEAEGEVTPGALTNWDEEGCFIQLQNSRSLPSPVKIRVQFKGREFIQEGEVVAEALDFTGVGIKFQKTPKDLNVFNWSEFTELIHELGFQPERLR